MEWKINKIEKYFLENNHHAQFHQVINNLSPNDLREIVNNILLSLKKIMSQKLKLKSNYITRLNIRSNGNTLE
jgi:hypothetical protein